MSLPMSDAPTQPASAPPAPNPRTLRIASRIAGVAGLAVVATAFPAGDDPSFTDASNAEIVSWVHQHVTGIYVQGFVGAVCMLLNAILLSVLLWRSGARGWMRQAGWTLIGTSLAIDMVNTGGSYTLAKLADRGASDDALLGVFSFVEQATFTDGITWGAVILIVALASRAARSLPSPVIWIALVTAVVHLVGVPAQLLATGTPQGLSGPISVMAFLLWTLTVSLLLLVRPGVRSPGASTASRDS